ncbi:MAG: alpha/beta fold hydrolase [Candidatus Thorarchaeota archaeon]
MDRIQSAVFVLLLFIFIGSLMSLLFSLAFQYPIARTVPMTEDQYDTSFWDLTTATTDPLNVMNMSDETSTIQTDEGLVQLKSWQFSYYSETFHDIEIRINSILVRPATLVSEAPAILVLHGYGSSSMGFIDFINQIASAGYYVLGIDAPGAGISTPYPPLNPYTFFDVSDGPESSHIFHSVWSAARAITFLESLPYVNSTILLGGSMGALETFILSAIDSRVDGSIPMIAGGNLHESIYSGSLLNSLINPNYEIGSDELEDLQRWFDPIAYARLLTRPIFMLYGTNDPFFVLSGIQQTVDAIEAPLTLSIRPNSGHVIDMSWSRLVARWLDENFRGGIAYPRVSTRASQLLTLQGWTLHISANSSENVPLQVFWRTADPGSVWATTPMRRVGDSYEIDITPLHLGKVTYFVCAVEMEYIWASTKISEGSGGSFFMPALAAISGIGVYLISGLTGWRLTKALIIREFPMFTGLIMIALGFLLPFYGITGRVQLSILEFVEVYGMILGLGGWFLSLTLLVLCYIIAVSALRHQLSFRLVLLVWFPLLVIITIAYIFFAGVFAVAGGLTSVYSGIGAFLLLFAVPVMMILESFFNKIVFSSTNILPVPESLPS